MVNLHKEKMDSNEANLDAFFHLTLPNRFKFLMDIWNKGAFQNDLNNVISLTDNESILDFAQILQSNGILTITDKANSNSQQDEKFFFISEENFKNIYHLICKIARYSFNEEVFQKLFSDKENFELITDKNIPLTISANEKLNEIHKIILEKTMLLTIDNKKALNNKEIFALELNLGYLLLIVINTSPTITSDKILDDFMDDAIIRVLQPNITTNRYYRQMGF